MTDSRSPSSGSEPELPFDVRYALGEKIGEGAFGTVYRAFDRLRAAPVAVKQLHRLTPHALYRFKSEYRAAAHLNHPNLVRFQALCARSGEGRRLDVAGRVTPPNSESADDEWFLVMDLVEGVPLTTYVRGADPPPPEVGRTIDHSGEFDVVNLVDAPLGPPDATRVRDTLKQLALGLVALHRAGMLHRDIKPTNILVTAEGRLVLLDLSVATRLEPGEQTRAMAGTPAYMAPELTTGEPLSEAADWYSVGVVLYECLTGRLPFSGGWMQMIQQKRTARPPPAIERVPEVPRDLSDLADALMDPDPVRRPGGADVLRRLGLAEQNNQTGSFRGRRAELATLWRAWEDVRSGAARVVTVEGASGMGKSALLRQFISRVRSGDERAVVLASRCFERESVPFKALDAAVDALARHLHRVPDPVRRAVAPRGRASLTRLFPVLGGLLGEDPTPDASDVAESRRRGATALRDLLARIGDRDPLLMWIDDAQWSDEDSAVLLAELLRPPDAPNLLLVVSSREGDNPVLRALRELEQESRSDTTFTVENTLKIGPLSPEEAREMASGLLEGGSWRTAARIAEESHGNPYFVEVLARAVQTGLTESPSLDELLRQHYQALPEEAQRLLATVALAGRPRPRVLLYTAAAVPIAHFEALDLLENDHLVRISGTAELVEPFHDRVREAVVAGLDPELAQRLHIGLARALAARERASGRPEDEGSGLGLPEAEGGGEPEAIATHLDAAGRTEEAGAWFIRAGARAADVRAFERSARLYRAAASRLAPGSPAQIDARRRLARALPLSGRVAEGARESLALVAYAPPELQLVEKARAALGLLISNHTEEGGRVLGEVASVLGLSVSRSRVGMVFNLLIRRLWLRVRGLGFRARERLTPEQAARIEAWWTGAVGHATFDQVRSAEYQVRGILDALSFGEPRSVARMLVLDIPFQALAGRPEVLAPLLAVTEPLVARFQDANLHASLECNIGIASLLFGQFPEAARRIRRAEDRYRSECDDVTWELDHVHRFYLRALLMLGRIREIDLRLATAVRVAAERGDRTVSAHSRLRALHLVRLAADQAESALEELGALRDGVAGAGFNYQHWVYAVGATETELYLGRGEAAWARLAGLEAELRRSFLLRTALTHAEWSWLRARAALMTGRLEEAGRAAKLLQRSPCAHGPGLALLAVAGVAIAEGRRALAGDALRSAASKLGPLQMEAQLAGINRARRGLGEDLAADDWAERERVMDPGKMFKMVLGFSVEG